MVASISSFARICSTIIEDELRPIPQAFIDALQNSDGTNLTAEQKAAWQNPGYK